MGTTKPLPATLDDVADLIMLALDSTEVGTRTGSNVDNARKYMNTALARIQMMIQTRVGSSADLAEMEPEEIVTSQPRILDHAGAVQTHGVRVGEDVEVAVLLEPEYKTTSA